MAFFVCTLLSGVYTTFVGVYILMFQVLDFVFTSRVFVLALSRMLFLKGLQLKILEHKLCLGHAS